MIFLFLFMYLYLTAAALEMKKSLNKAIWRWMTLLDNWGKRLLDCFLWNYKIRRQSMCFLLLFDWSAVQNKYLVEEKMRQ